MPHSFPDVEFLNARFIGYAGEGMAQLVKDDLWQTILFQQLSEKL
jgi:hypothetical protein